MRYHAPSVIRHLARSNESGRACGSTMTAKERFPSFAQTLPVFDNPAANADAGCCSVPSMRRSSGARFALRARVVFSDHRLQRVFVQTQLGH